jgi:hypothetical protein
MDNVWGRGGLFERALSSKIANQDAETARTASQVGVDQMNAGTNRFNADTNLLEANNRYDLGLRDNAVNQSNADTNRMDAGTNRFNAETNRVTQLNTNWATGAPTRDTSTALGLRSFNSWRDPLTGGSVAGTERNRPLGFGMNNGGMVPKMTTTPGYNYGGMVPQMKTTPGYGNGGKVPQMKAMAGYGKGGKVKMMVGCKDGGAVAPEQFEKPTYMGAVKDRVMELMGPRRVGTGAADMAAKELEQRKGKINATVDRASGMKRGGAIGDVREDTGEDTIPAKVRPGEYLLNPETVARGFGDGDYSAGVRNLNQIVRSATGKEPGPSPLPKGEAGFANSGGAGRTFYADADGTVSDDPNMGEYRRAAEERAAQARGAAAQAQADAAPSRAQRVANATGASSVSRGTGRWSDLDTSNRMAEGIRNSRLGVAGGALGVVSGGYNVGQGLADRDYTRAALGATDAAASAAPFVAGAAAIPAALVYGAGRTGWGAGSMIYDNMEEDTRDTIGGTINQGVRSLGKMFGQDWGVDDTQYLQQRAVDRAAAEARAAQPVAESEAPSAPPAAQPEQAVEEAPPSLRNMLLDRYNKLNGELDKSDQIGQAARLIQMRAIQGDLANLEAAEMAANSRGASGQSKADKDREDADKRIDSRFQIPVRDDEGQITGYKDDSVGRNSFRDFIAQLRDPNTGQPIDFYALSKDAQDRVFNNYDTNVRATRAFEQRVAEESGGLVSGVPRVGSNSLRLERNADGSTRPVTIGDIGDPNISIGDWMSSFGGGLRNQIAVDPRTGQRVVASRVVRRPEGGIDQDVLESLQAAK